MECSRCGSQNVKTFGMAYASYNAGDSSWDAVVKFLLLGPLGLLLRPGRNSVAETTAPPEKSFPLLAVIFGLLLFSTLIWLVSIYSRRGLSYPETQDALIVNAFVLLVASAVIVWDIVRYVRARREYPELMDRWIHSWICLQCGTTYEVREQMA